MADVYRDYFNGLVTKLRNTYLERRRDERENEKRLMSGEGISSTDSVNSVRSSWSTNLPLKVTAATFYPKGNGNFHRTKFFELVQREAAPVLRRGQTFFIALAFGQDQNKRNYDPNSDEIRLIFTFGPQSSRINGTQQILKISQDSDKLFHAQDETRWAARIKGHDKGHVTIEVRSTSDCQVGIWKCKIETNVMSSKKSEDDEIQPSPQVYTPAEDIYILFNPWNEKDVTYMQETELLTEYVLEDTGKVWVGPISSSRGRPWIYGQFDDSVLPLVMVILEKSGLSFSQRGNPILVSRALSKMVNSNDDNGILVGRWDGKYKDGTPPAGWTGSVPIIEEYFQSMKPVKYGQCWVFAGVLCTVCRALGIPCRVVSNLVSAHDANGTLTIDRYFNEKNEEIDYDPNNPIGGRDSIWNFHVWNDVWMARPDLPKGYGGWQAIDSTPQEKSDGIYQCGPSSLEAIRKGKTGFAYDVPFVLAEVNADLVRWREDKSSDFGFIRMEANRYHVGRQILTKKPNVFDSEGDSDKSDIIDEYKPKEGSTTERLQLLNAVRGSNRQGAAHFFELNPKEEDMEFDLIELDQVPNKSSESRTVKCHLSAKSIYYNGLKGSMVKNVEGKFVVQPNSNEELRMTVQAKEYLDKLVEYGIMKIFAICAVVETNQTWSEEDDFQVVKPPLSIQVSSNLKVGKLAYVTFSFVNPIKQKLTKCVIKYEGHFLSRFSEIQHKDIEIGKEMKVVHRFIPRSSGSQRIVGTFTSKELIDIVGSAFIQVD